MKKEIIETVRKTVVELSKEEVTSINMYEGKSLEHYSLVSKEERKITFFTFYPSNLILWKSKGFNDKKVINYKELEQIIKDYDIMTNCFSKKLECIDIEITFFKDYLNVIIKNSIGFILEDNLYYDK